MAKIIDGRRLAQIREKNLVRQLVEFKKISAIQPKLVNILIGDNPASRLYLSLKQKAAQRVGIKFEKKVFSAAVNPVTVRRYIIAKNAEFQTTGIMIQLPLPKKSAIRKAQFAILNARSPNKDVDCLTPANFGLLAMNQPRFLPATVKAIMAIIENFKFKIENCTITVVGASNIVGKPLALHLSNLGATVTICRSTTRDLAKHTRQADILISATGVQKLIKKEMVKKGTVVIDAGSPQADVCFNQVVPKASFITPVPGGVGPLTIISLLENVLQAARQANKFDKFDKNGGN